MDRIKKFPVLLCFDVEPDPRIPAVSGANDWRGFESSRSMLEAFRPLLQSSTKMPVHYSWFFRLDPQIHRLYGDAAFPLKKYEDWVHQLQEEGDELGIHPHNFRWDEETGEWVAVHDDPEFARMCTQTCFDAYRSFFGRAPASYRFGDKWTHESAIELCEKNGARFDLTLEPDLPASPHVMVDERHEGTLPSFERVPKKPYIPDRRNFRQADAEGRTGPYMIPLTTGKLPGLTGFLHHLNRRYVKQKFHEQRILTLGLDFKPWMFKALFTRALQCADYVTTITRVSAAGRERTAQFMKANLTWLANHKAAGQFMVARPDETFELWRKRYPWTNVVKPPYAMRLQSNGI